MPKVFQPTDKTIADTPADKRFVNLHIDGDGMFCCSMNNIVYYTRVGAFKWDHVSRWVVLRHEQGGVLQLTTPYGTTVDAMWTMEDWASANVTEFSLQRDIKLYWDRDEIGPFKYRGKSRPVTYEEVFVSKDGELVYRSQHLPFWSSKPSEVLCSISYNKIKIIRGLEDPQHARPFGEQEQILDDSCWTGKELAYYWSRPLIKSGMREVVLPSTEYDVSPAHKTHSRLSLRSFM